MANRTGYVYGITNIVTGQWYVGKTINKRGVNQRWQTHVSNLKKSKHPNTYLQNSWNKYGSKCFMFVVLFSTTMDEDDINDFIFEKETYYTKMMNAEVCNNGFTMVVGNGKGKIYPEYVRVKQSKSLKGRKRPHLSGENHPMWGKVGAAKGRHHTEEAKRKISASRKGKPMSEESKRRLSESRKNANIKYKKGKDNVLSKSVIKLDKDKNYIQSYESIEQASKLNNVCACSISRVCRGIRKTAGGFIWMYENIYLKGD